jgi:mycothiol synthase
MYPDVTVAIEPDATLIAKIGALLDRAGRDGSPVLSDPKRMTALGPAGARDGLGGDVLIADVVVAAGGDGPLRAFAPVIGDRAARHYAVELIVDPDDSAGSDLRDTLLDAAVDLVTGAGGGTLRLWSHNATDNDDRRAEARGFRRERDLLQMRCALPLDRAVRHSPPVHTRPFRPGRDEGAWLTTNNRSFRSHPEQGRWTLADVEAREKEPWFDPEGLLLLDEDGRLAGSCWTKVHADSTPPMGEIYVIGIDPDFQGRGWGRALTEAGLDHLAGRGLTVGMLYVDADNTAAVSLYRSMGFTEHHVDRAYVGVFG